MDRVTAGREPPEPSAESQPKPADEGQRLFFELIDKIYDAAEMQGLGVDYRDPNEEEDSMGDRS